MPVLLKDLASAMGLERSTARKAIKRAGIPTMLVRDAQSGNQCVLAVSSEDAERFSKMRKDMGYGELRQARQSENYLYVLVIDPQVRPERVKIGTTTDCASRFNSYRTIAPELEVRCVWSAPSACEGYLLTLAASIGVAVGQEVFDFPDEALDEFVAIADAAMANFAQKE